MGLAWQVHYLFPNQIYTDPDYKFKATSLMYKLWGNKYVEYESGIYDDKTVWTFIRYTEEEQYNNIVPELRGEFCGYFQWNGWYRFRLYRSPPDFVP